MNQEDVIRMAREADAAHDDVVITPFLERFAALVAAAERDACAAKIQDQIDHAYLQGEIAVMASSLEAALDAIRERGQA